jgi:hypothetical protein
MSGHHECYLIISLDSRDIALQGEQTIVETGWKSEVAHQ